MGTTKVAAAMAALLAGMVIAVSFAAGSPTDNGQWERPHDQSGLYGLQPGSGVRGQAWATELFGRRYGRNLLAAVAPQPGDGEART